MAYLLEFNGGKLSLPSNSNTCLHERAGDSYKMEIPASSVLVNDKICLGKHEHLITVTNITVV